MAYRRLFAVTLTALAASVACGGESTSAGGTSGINAQQAPSNADKPPTSSDRPPASSEDSPPSNDDAPPGSADPAAGSGGGGRLVNLCKEFCKRAEDVLDTCGGEDAPSLENLCPDDAACQVPANFPCVQEALDAYDCLLDLLGGICSAGGMTSTSLDACQDSLKGLTDCAQDQAGQTPGGNNPGAGGEGPGSGPVTDCATGDACSRCVCQAGTDVNKIQACASTCTTP